VLQIPGIENALTLPIGDGVESIEKEPNDSANEATRLDLPFAVTGLHRTPWRPGPFRFCGGKRARNSCFKFSPASLGFVLDAWLKIEDIKGKELAKSDDSGNADPVLEWTPGEDGTFVAAVGQRPESRRGGPSLSVEHSTAVARSKSRCG
jgi:hypothetical protein